MAWVLEVDGYDFDSNLGFKIVRRLEGWLDSVDEKQMVRAMHRKYTPYVSNSHSKAGVRTFRIVGHLSAATHATAQTNLSELKERVGRARPNSPITVAFDTAATTHFECYQNGKIRVNEVKSATAIYEVTIPLVAVDGREYDNSDTVIGSIQTSNIDMTLGTAPHTRVSISVTGATTFTLDYKDSSGTVLHSLGLTSATGTQPFVFDLEDGTVLDSAGTPVSQMDFLDAGSEFFTMDPRDGVVNPRAWPKLTCSAGTATATFKRAWR